MYHYGGDQPLVGVGLIVSTPLAARLSLQAISVYIRRSSYHWLLDEGEEARVLEPRTLGGRTRSFLQVLLP